MKMQTIQVAAIQPGIHVKNKSQLRSFPSRPCGLLMNTNPPSGLPHLPLLKSRQPLQVCLAGGKGMMDHNKDSQRKSLDNALESIEGILQQKIRKGEYYEDGGSGAKPPGGRGGGGGGGSNGSDDGNETLQIVLATIGFIFVYIYVINGAEFTKLARDIIRYLLGGGQSPRLQRTMYKWVRFYKNVTGNKEVDKNGLKPQQDGTTQITRCPYEIKIR